jgi:hypothetical protein
MKTIILFCAATIILAASLPAHADVIAGPITNPTNGHEYYLLTASTWPEAEAEAETLGGTLAIIRNDAEEEWVFSNFGSRGGTSRNLWLGLQRPWPGADFLSVMGSKPEYYNWGAGEPNNTGGNETVVQLLDTGKWNDNVVTAIETHGLVEVPGKSDPEALTDQEKAIIGTWYESGNGERPAWITGTQNKLFLITHDRHAARLIFTPEGHIFNTDRIFGDVVQDKIVWSNGTWWSRMPSKYYSSGKGPQVTSQAIPLVVPD